ncbi:MAG: hypothetical protein RXP86_11230 [Acidilobus sp.]
MASCQPKVPEIKYCDESWWQEFFTKDLAEFYASLNGLLRAREALLKELSGDLAQVLADPQRRDLALRVLFGGLDEACLEKMEHGYFDCITAGKAAYFYRYVFGIGLREDYGDDLEERKRLLNLLKTMSFEEIGKEKLGVSINGYTTFSMMDDLLVTKGIVDDIYSRIEQVIHVQHMQADYGLDLVKAFEDFLNKSIKLLPLYNPFTFFIQSLRSTPRPYLNIMYCEELFSDPVRNLMGKYGVELTEILDPGLDVQSMNDELAIIGHKGGSVGKLILKLVREIYYITSGYSASDEVKKYVEAKYNEETSAGCTLKKLIRTTKAHSKHKKYCVSYETIIEVEKGFVKPFDGTPIKYESFLELFSPLLFLGIASIECSRDRYGLLNAILC